MPRRPRTVVTRRTSSSCDSRLYFHSIAQEINTPTPLLVKIGKMSLLRRFSLMPLPLTEWHCQFANDTPASRNLIS